MSCKKIANTIYQSVQFTYDYPSNPKQGKMPVLDLKMYVDESGMVRFEFYQKPMACMLVIPQRSAHSGRMKLAAMVEEGVRRLRNFSRGLEWELRREAMEDWATKLSRSGYPAAFRHQVIKTAVEKWDRMCQDEDEGKRPIHRARDWQEPARRLEKESRRESWHQAGSSQITAPLILDPTAGDLTRKLKAVCEIFEKSSGLRVTLREGAGDPPFFCSMCERKRFFLRLASLNWVADWLGGAGRGHRYRPARWNVGIVPLQEELERSWKLEFL